MLFFYALSSLFIAWIWVDYFRLIDIYDRDELKYLIATFFIGGISVPIVFYLNYQFLEDFAFGLNGSFLNDLLYCVLHIGLVEELAKLIPILIILKIFKKQITEPIDIIAYSAIVALGFAAIENTMYFSNYGSQIISGRSVLSTVGHMFFTSLTAYGILRYRFLNHNAKGQREFLLFFAMAAISHGLYDFFLMHRHFEYLGYFILLIFFLEGVSVFAIILNNSLNNSKFFSYSKVINNSQISNRLLLYYLMVFVIQFLMITFESGFSYALLNLGAATVTTGFIIFILSTRLSRFKLIQGRWFPLKFELPFYFAGSDVGGGSYFRLRIRGEAYNEVYLNKHYQNYFWICPFGRKSSKLESPKLAYIEEKLFLNKDETYYLTKLFLDETQQRSEYILIKPKVFGKKFTEKKSPIVAVLDIPDFTDLSNNQLKQKDFHFVSWAYPKDASKWEKN